MLQDDAPSVVGWAVGKSRGGNYDEAKRTGELARCCLDFGNSNVKSNVSESCFNNHGFLSLS
jgi:hypothetical protein